jgi:hypothetical protein
VSDLFQLVDIIIPILMKNHEEPEAVDLLMEVEGLERTSRMTPILRGYATTCFHAPTTLPTQMRC